jgi:hypothetical protein
VDNLRSGEDGTSARAHRLRSDVERLLRELHEQSRLVTDTGERSTRSALLGMRLVRWRIALLRGDLHEIGQAQAAALKQLGSWTLPADLETVTDFQRAGARLGIPADSSKVERLRSQVPDRGHLRPYTSPNRNTPPAHQKPTQRRGLAPAISGNGSDSDAELGSPPRRVLLRRANSDTADPKNTTRLFNDDDDPFADHPSHERGRPQWSRSGPLGAL